MATLRLQTDGGASKEFRIGATITIGRLPDNTVVIDQPAGSSHHACIFREGETFVLEDLQSTNGTFVNERGVRARGPAEHQWHVRQRSPHQPLPAEAR